MDPCQLDSPETIEQLLTWASTYTSSPVFSLVQLSAHLPELLPLIHSELSCPAHDAATILEYVQRYLSSFLGKTLKRRFRLLLLSPNPLPTLLGLLLYICVHCPNKARFIKDILEHPPNTQSILMKVIEMVDARIENIMEIKEILEKVEELEIQNEGLRAEVRREGDRNRELAERLEQIMEDYKTVEEQCESYKCEKAEVLKELNISSLADYMQLFKAVQNENMEMMKNMEKMDKKIMELTKDKINYKAKIVQDSQLISDLNEELCRLKDVCRSLRLSSSLSIIDIDSGSGDTMSMSLDAKVLKQNKVLTNRQLSAEQLLPKKTLFTTIDLQESPQSFDQLKYEFQQLALKYEKMEDIAETQKEALDTVQASNDRLRRYNDFLQGKMQELKSIHGDMLKVMRA